MKEKELLEGILGDINQGKLTVMWDSWNFSGGHGEDHQRFRINTKCGELFGYLDVNETDDIDILIESSSDDNLYGYVLDGVDLDEWITTLLQRDDVKIYNLCHDDSGKLQLPAGYKDISRDVFLNKLSYSREVNKEIISVTRYDMNEFSIRFSRTDVSMRGTAYDVVEELAGHFGLKYDDIHAFADINFNLDTPLMTTTCQDMAVSNVWMDSSARFSLYTMRAFDEWDVQGVIDFVIDAANYINTHKFQIRVLKCMRAQDLALVRTSFNDVKNSAARQNIVLDDNGIYFTFKAELPEVSSLQFGELVCWVEDEVLEDDTVYDCIANAIKEYYSDTDAVLNERITSGKINFTKY